MTCSNPVLVPLLGVTLSQFPPLFVLADAVPADAVNETPGAIDTPSDCVCGAPPTEIWKLNDVGLVRIVSPETVSVTGTANGLFDEPAAVMVNVP